MIADSISRAELAGKVQTVLGIVPPETLGVSLAHEHLLIDLTSSYAAGGEPSEAAEINFYRQPVSVENRGLIAYHITSNRDNLVLNDEKMIIREALRFKHAGGDTIVDHTTRHMGRDPLGMARISRATGLNVVMGSGYYLETAQPVDMGSKTEDDICEEIVREITVGVGSTGVRAGVIGEIGCSCPITDNERKSLRAAAKAQQVTGAPMSVHPGRNADVDAASCLEIIDTIGEAGADVSHTVILHIDRTIVEPEERLKLAATGCYLGYDLFGWEGYHIHPAVPLPTDHQRISEIMHLGEHGYLSRILVSQDIAWKHRLRCYGGHGYEHMLCNVVPIMQAKGMTEGQINTLLVENPKNFLTFA